MVFSRGHIREVQEASFDTAGSVSSSGTEKLKNLAVGDEFSTYDYIVTVTEVSGSEATGWTGRGELSLNFLKIGANPVIEIPLAVKFENMHLNQCYQILPGSKVITEFDAGWGNVASIDEIQDELAALKQEIIELIEAGTPSTDLNLQSLLTRMGEIRDEEVSTWDSDVSTGVTGNINNFISGASCAAPPANSNVRMLSCGDPDDALDAMKNYDLDGYILVTTAKTIKDNLPKTPDLLGSGAGYSIVYNDKPRVNDTRFDYLGKTRYKYWINMGLSKTHFEYFNFIKEYGLGSMALHLKSGTGSDYDLSKDAQIQTEILQSIKFVEFFNGFQDVVKSKISASAISQINDALFNSLSSGPDGIRPPNFSDVNVYPPIIPKVFIAMGGTQAYDITLNLYRKKAVSGASTTLSDYRFVYNIILKDLYGADFDDINATKKALSPALNAFFTLQHFYGYRPYVTKVKIEKYFTYQ